MFAWELAAWAGTAKCRLGQINLRLVRVFAAALAQPPRRPFVGAERLPFARRGQALSGLGRSRVRREGQDLFGSPIHIHLTTVSLQLAPGSPTAPQASQAT